MAFDCKEDWDKMKIGCISRFCGNCHKDVIDFTKMSRVEILKYLFEHRDHSVCGRIYPSQLDYSHQELMIVINSLGKKPKNQNLAFFLLTVGALAMVSCAPEEQHLKEPTDQTEIMQNEVSSLDMVIDSPPQEFITTGFVVCEDSITPNEKLRPDDVRYITEVMPEFPGGTASLFKFFEQQVKYPEKERKLAVSGKLYVEFIVEKDGSISNPKVIKSLAQSKNLDQEALRVISLMPRWTPGKEHGEPVRVKMVLPIAFKL